jgi:bla regulator protein blaR1
VAAWLAVATTLFVNRMIAYGRDRRAILAASVPVARIGAVRIVRSPEIASPVALGIFDRLIAVPSDFERLYDARERRLVLEHELAHHRSGDLVANLFAFVLLCLQWFNPLAWVAHAAFRFDQEAACDARVLDEGTGSDRGDYGRAIAKAASGRALMFASALDRRKTLQRRLQSMLRNPNPTRRFGIAVALPLTASRAVQYVDVPSLVPATPSAAATPQVVPIAARQETLPAAVEQAPPPQVVDAAVSSAAEPPLRLTVAAAASQAMPLTQVAAGGVAIAAPAGSLPRASLHDERDNLTITGDMITIDGVRKRWEDLTPAEKARVRSAVAKANQALAGVHIDQARIAQDLAHIPDQAQMAELQQQLAQTRVRVAQSADAARPSVVTIDWPRIAQSVEDARRAVAAIDWPRVRQSAAGAQQSIDNAKAELDRIQVRIDADQRP